MKKNMILEQINADLTELCIKIGNRHVGSIGNKKATRYVSERLASSGFIIESSEFKCIDWKYEGVVLNVADDEIEAFISPYSSSCEIKSYFDTASNVHELSKKNFTNKIAVLHGDLCKEQLMPKNFAFYNPESHKEIIQLLEEKKPNAIIAITSYNPELAGACYPFPLIEDGDFDIPSIYMTEEQGEKILNQLGSQIYLKIESERMPSNGYNVIGKKGKRSNPSIVFCAHVDTKKGTSGALDNGTGVSMLLTLADLLKDYSGDLGVEILAVNGEDYYSNCGEMLYLSQNKKRLEEIILAVNADGIGHAGYRNTFTCFECSDEVDRAIRGAFADDEKFVEIEPWYQGDHMIFVMNQVPGIALTSENYIQIMTEIAHTEKDKIDNVDANKILEISYAMKELIYKLNDIIEHRA